MWIQFLGHFHNSLFSLKLKKVPNKQKYFITQVLKSLPGTNTLAYWVHLYPKKLPNKQECYITHFQNSLPETNTLAYWAHSKVRKKINCCEYGSWYHIDNSLFSLYLKKVPNKQECFITHVQNSLQRQTL